MAVPVGPETRSSPAWSARLQIEGWQREYDERTSKNSGESNISDVNKGLGVRDGKKIEKGRGKGD